MSDSVPRLRMFAGPNGSGKTTIKRGLNKPATWFGIYLNPDDLEQEIRQSGFLSLAPFGFNLTTQEVQDFFSQSTLLKNAGLDNTIHNIVCSNHGIHFSGIEFNSYYASTLSSFFQNRALDESKSLTFETVMSHRDKVDVLRIAQERGFRTYLYYIATEDPDINLQRIRNRVAEGEHAVPEEKVASRYQRSLDLLPEAIRYSHRAFLFDTSKDFENSTNLAPFFAEITDGKTIHFHADEIPIWFERYANQYTLAE